jgi:hypothetical protein
METYPQKFIEYHAKYPKVYEYYKGVIAQLINRGFKKYSSDGVLHIVRFTKHDEIKKDGFKVNNNYTPYYARLYESEHPELKGFFAMRKTKVNSFAD